VTPELLDVLRRAVREALDSTVLTRDELVAAVIAQRGLGHIGEALRSGWGSLLKPLAWQGDLCFGPSRGNRAEVEVDGERAYVLAEDLDELVSTRPTTVVRLLPGFDQYVLGSGTADGHVVPVARRAAVSKQSGWISPVVVAGGVVCGTWQLDGEPVRVAWFREAGGLSRNALEAEVARPLLDPRSGPRRGDQPRVELRWRMSDPEAPRRVSLRLFFASAHECSETATREVLGRGRLSTPPFGDR
jgi:hypothetical protein